MNHIFTKLILSLGIFLLAFSLPAAANPTVSISQGASKINLIKDDPSVDFSIRVVFESGTNNNNDLYNIRLEQAIRGDESGVVLNLIGPNSWSATTSTEWRARARLQGAEVGNYRLISTVTLVLANGEEIIQRATTELIISVIDEEEPPTLIELGSLVSNPSVISMSQPTSAVFSIRVYGDVDQIGSAESIRLEEVNADGSLIEDLGILTDDGMLNSDLGGDGTYQRLVDISSSPEGNIYFRVSFYPDDDDEEIISSELHKVKVTRFPVGFEESDMDSLVDNEEGYEVFTNELLVDFLEGVAPERIEEIVSDEGGRIVGSVLELNIIQIKLSGQTSLESVQSVREELETYPEVNYAELNGLPMEMDSFTPNDPDFPGQLNMKVIRAEDAWAVVPIIGDTKSIRVAVLDSGVDESHPDFQRGSRSRVYCPQDSDCVDTDGHGTHVAGIIAATGNNRRGVAGVSWFTQIVSIKVLPESGTRGSLSQVVEGISNAVNLGVPIMNMSLGSDYYSPAMENAVNRASSNGILVVAAAGNDNKFIFGSGNNNFYPCAFRDVLCVGNSTNTDARYLGVGGFGGSNYGPPVDIAAPGVEVLSTVPGGRYERYTGTSLSAPLVAGAAALLLSTVKSKWDINEIESYLIRAGKPLDPRWQIGRSRLDLYETVFDPQQQLPSESSSGGGGSIDYTLLLLASLMLLIAFLQRKVYVKRS